MGNRCREDFTGTAYLVSSTKAEYYSEDEDRKFMILFKKEENTIEITTDFSYDPTCFDWAGTYEK